MSKEPKFVKLTSPLVPQVQQFLKTHARESLSFGQLLAYCVHPNTTAFVLLNSEDSTIVGFIGGQGDESQGKIDILCVHSEYRQLGWGEQLVVKFMSTHALANYALEVRQSNKKAQRLYKRLGFSEKDVMPAFYRNEDALVMHLG